MSIVVQKSFFAKRTTSQLLRKRSRELGERLKSKRLMLETAEKIKQAKAALKARKVKADDDTKILGWDATIQTNTVLTYGDLDSGNFTIGDNGKVIVNNEAANAVYEANIANDHTTMVVRRMDNKITYTIDGLDLACGSNEYQEMEPGTLPERYRPLKPVVLNLRGTDVTANDDDQIPGTDSTMYAEIRPGGGMVIYGSLNKLIAKNNPVSVAYFLDDTEFDTTRISFNGHIVQMEAVQENNVMTYTFKSANSYTSDYPNGMDAGTYIEWNSGMVINGVDYAPHTRGPIVKLRVEDEIYTAAYAKIVPNTSTLASQNNAGFQVVVFIAPDAPTGTKCKLKLDAPISANFVDAWQEGDVQLSLQNMTYGTFLIRLDNENGKVVNFSYDPSNIGGTTDGHTWSINGKTTMTIFNAELIDEKFRVDKRTVLDLMQDNLFISYEKDGSVKVTNENASSTTINQQMAVSTAHINLGPDENVQQQLVTLNQGVQMDIRRLDDVIVCECQGDGQSHSTAALDDVQVAPEGTVDIDKRPSEGEYWIVPLNPLQGQDLSQSLRVDDKGAVFMTSPAGESVQNLVPSHTSYITAATSGEDIVWSQFDSYFKVWISRNDDQIVYHVLPLVEDVPTVTSNEYQFAAAGAIPSEWCPDSGYAVTIELLVSASDSEFELANNPISPTWCLVHSNGSVVFKIATGASKYDTTAAAQGTWIKGSTADSTATYGGTKTTLIATRKDEQINYGIILNNATTIPVQEDVTDISNGAIASDLRPTDDYPTVTTDKPSSNPAIELPAVAGDYTQYAVINKDGGVTISGSATAFPSWACNTTTGEDKPVFTVSTTNNSADVAVDEMANSPEPNLLGMRSYYFLADGTMVVGGFLSWIKGAVKKVGAAIKTGVRFLKDKLGIDVGALAQKAITIGATAIAGPTVGGAVGNFAGGWVAKQLSGDYRLQHGLGPNDPLPVGIPMIGDDILKPWRGVKLFHTRAGQLQYRFPRRRCAVLPTTSVEGVVMRNNLCAMTKTIRYPIDQIKEQQVTIDTTSLSQLVLASHPGMRANELGWSFGDWIKTAFRKAKNVVVDIFKSKIQNGVSTSFTIAGQAIDINLSPDFKLGLNMKTSNGSKASVSLDPSGSLKYDLMGFKSGEKQMWSTPFAQKSDQETFGDKTGGDPHAEYRRHPHYAKYYGTPAHEIYTSHDVIFDSEGEMGPTGGLWHDIHPEPVVLKHACVNNATNERMWLAETETTVCVTKNVTLYLRDPLKLNVFRWIKQKVQGIVSKIDFRAVGRKVLGAVGVFCGGLAGGNNVKSSALDAVKDFAKGGLSSIMKPDTPIAIPAQTNDKKMTSVVQITDQGEGTVSKLPGALPNTEPVSTAFINTKQMQDASGNLTQSFRAIFERVAIPGINPFGYTLNVNPRFAHRITDPNVIVEAVRDGMLIQYYITPLDGTKKGSVKAGQKLEFNLRPSRDLTVFFGNGSVLIGRDGSITVNVDNGSKAMAGICIPASTMVLPRTFFNTES